MDAWLDRFFPASPPYSLASFLFHSSHWGLLFILENINIEMFLFQGLCPVVSPNFLLLSILFQVPKQGFSPPKTNFTSFLKAYLPFHPGIVLRDNLQVIEHLSHFKMLYL